jgi:hypothetical protein
LHLAQLGFGKMKMVQGEWSWQSARTMRGPCPR